MRPLRYKRFTKEPFKIQKYFKSTNDFKKYRRIEITKEFCILRKK